MPPGTEPATSHVNETNIPSPILSGDEEISELKNKAEPIVQDVGQLVIKEKGIESNEATDLATLLAAITDRILKNTKYPTLPPDQLNKYKQKVETAVGDVAFNEAERLIGAIELIKKGIAFINAFREAPKRLISYAADPVMMFNGQFTHTAQDLHINGAGINFQFVRTYKNQSLYKGPLGFHWDHNYNLWLRVLDDQNTIVRSTGQMREDTFVRHEIFDYWVPPDGDDGIIQQNGNSFVYRMMNGTRLFYKQSSQELAFFHRIDTIEDRFGNYLKFTYEDDQLRLVEVNHQKRLIQINTDSTGKIETITDFMGRTWQYRYDDFDDLVAVTSPKTDRYPAGLTSCFEYSSSQFTGELQHNLTRIIDAKGQLYLENEYGTSPGVLGFNRVVRQRQGGGETLFEYEDVIEEFEFDYRDSERPAHQTTMMARNGQLSRHIYNRFGNLLYKEECVVTNGIPRKLRSHFRYNRDGNLVATLTPEGVVTQFLYGREVFIREHQIENEDDIVANDNLTIEARQSFNRLLATVRRQRYFTFENLNLARDVWGDIFPDIIGGIELDPQGNAKDIIVKFTYEPTYGQLLTQSDPRFTNSAVPNAILEHARHQETLTRYEYQGPVEAPDSDPTRFLIRIVSPTPVLPDGTPSGLVQQKFTMADPNNPNVEIPAYDPHGRILRQVNPVGVITEFRYVPEDNNDLKEGHLKKTIIDPGGLGITMAFDIDDLGRVVATHLPKSVDVTDGRFIMRTVYNELDQVIETKSSKPFEFVTRNFYDRNGKLERVEHDAQDENGAAIAGAPVVATFCYDEEFHLIHATMGGGDESAHLVTKHRYDIAGQRVLTLLPEGNQMRYRYDERLLPIAEITGAGSGEAATTRIEYDGDNRVRRVFDARGNPTTFTLDAFGRTTAKKDALGHISRRDYDKMNNVTVTRFFEKRDNAYFLLSRSETNFDELSRAISGIADRFEEPPGLIDKKDLATAFLGAPVLGSKQIITETFYDEQNRPRKTIDPLKREYLTEYDNLDRVILQTDPLGNQVVNHYDQHSNLLRTDRIEMERENPDVPEQITGQRVFSSSAIYDELDRMISSTDSLGNITHSFYDSRGNLVRTIDPLENVMRMDYDIFNRLIAKHRELTETGLGGSAVMNTVSTRSEYDRNNNLKTVIDALGRRTQYRYDALDRQRTILYPDKSEFLLAYDADGNLIRTTDNNGLQRIHTVDELGRTTRIDVQKPGPAGFQVGGATFEQYTYDGLDRLRHEENDFVRCSMRFNSLSWPIEETMTYSTPDAPIHTPFVITRAYDDVGAQTDLTYPNGRKLHFDRDKLDRLTAIRNVTKGATYPGNAATPDEHDLVAFDYAGLQRRRCRLGNGTLTSYAHDSAARVIEIAHASPTEPLLKVQYLFDPVSNVRIRNDTSPSETVKELFAYDSLYRLVNEGQHTAVLFDPTPLAPASTLVPGPIPNRQADINTRIGSLTLPVNPTTYEYDLVGNREKERDGSEISYRPNDLDQYFEITDLANGVPTTTHPFYDANGNLKDDDHRKYIYDSLNRLVEVSEGGVALAKFFHDASGRRILELANGRAIQLICNGNNLIAEYQDENLLAQYVYDAGVDRPVQIAAEGSEHWYHLDLVGSVRMLTDQQGHVDESTSYQYAPFGKLLNAGDGVFNPLRYSARRLDEVLGTYDYRARQYDPELGRFLQRDPEGMVDGTCLYTYTGNNPLAFADPFGAGREERNLGEIDLPAGRPFEKTWTEKLYQGPDWFNGGMGPNAKRLFKSLGEDQQFAKSLMDRGHGCAACHISARLWNVPGAVNQTNGLINDWVVNEQGYESWVQTSSMARVIVGTLIPIGNARANWNSTPRSPKIPKGAKEARGKDWKKVTTPEGEGARKLFWGSWHDYPKVSAFNSNSGKMETYAVIGDRLYSHHAVNRMQPSGHRFPSVGSSDNRHPLFPQIQQTGTPAKPGRPYDYGRSISPNWVEEVIDSSTGYVQPNGNIEHVFGSIKVVLSPQGRTITIGPWSM
jgi:RHS repeat-associated protein